MKHSNTQPTAKEQETMQEIGSAQQIRTAPALHTKRRGKNDCVSIAWEELLVHVFFMF